jgi:hypothetical protein
MSYIEQLINKMVSMFKTVMFEVKNGEIVMPDNLDDINALIKNASKSEEHDKRHLTNEEYIQIAKEDRFNNSRKYRRACKPPGHSYCVSRGLELLKEDVRFQNKYVVAKIKAANVSLKTRNLKLQMKCRANYRTANPDLDYDFNIWDRIPRDIYDVGALHSVESLNNPIIKWVVANA